MKTVFSILQHIMETLTSIHDVVKVGEVRAYPVTAPLILYLDLDAEENRPTLSSAERRLRFNVVVVLSRTVHTLNELDNAFELANKVKRTLENKIFEANGSKVVVNYNDSVIAYNSDLNYFSITLRFIAQYRE